MFSSKKPKNPDFKDKIDLIINNLQIKGTGRFMKTIEHKFIGDLKKLEQENIFTNRIIIGQNKMRIMQNK